MQNFVFSFVKLHCLHRCVCFALVHFLVCILRQRQGQRHLLTMAHICDRENCSPANVNGPKCKCVKCKKGSFLFCHNIREYKKEYLEIKLPTGAAIIVDMSSYSFVCPECENDPAGLTALMLPSKRVTPSAPKTPTTPTNKAAISLLTARVDRIYNVVTASNDKIDRKIDDLKAAMDETKSEVIEAKNAVRSTVVATNEMMAKVAQGTSLGPSTPRQKRPLFSTVVKAASEASLAPVSAKRNRNDVLVDVRAPPSAPIPSPKQGVKNASIGPPIERRTARVNDATNKKLSKSLWISPLHPTVSAEDMKKYVTENTALKDVDKFFCKKLVKKDQDLSTLSYVSFKIDVTDEDFVLISDPSNWPRNISVREFVRVDKAQPSVALNIASAPPAAPIMLSPSLPSPKIQRIEQNRPTTSTAVPNLMD